MEERECKEWLRLASSKLETKKLLPLLRELMTPEAVFGASDQELNQQYHLSKRDAEKLRSTATSSTIQLQYELLKKNNITPIPLHSPVYPANLFQLVVPPPLLFVKGMLEQSDQLAVAIVGPRNPTSYSSRVTTHLVEELAPLLTVVSGAAIGIDTIAHSVCLRKEGRTIAVLGCGIDQDYPARNRRLRETIGQGKLGALVSTFPPGTPPTKGNFPLRNVILAGLSLAVIVVEASSKSGALVTARAANEEGRLVYAVPGDIDRTNSHGSNRLLRDGALVCTCADDILHDLEPHLTKRLEELKATQKTLVTAEKKPPAMMTGAAKSLLEAISHEPMAFDDLVARFVPDRIPFGELSQILLKLEMEKFITQQPGRIYARRI